MSIIIEKQHKLTKSSQSIFIFHISSQKVTTWYIQKISTKFEMGRKIVHKLAKILEGRVSFCREKKKLT
jgi:hypothetical protein